MRSFKHAPETSLNLQPKPGTTAAHQWPSEEIRKSWSGSFTDPRTHDDNRFCYLVYAYNPPAQLALRELARREKAYSSSADMGYVNLLEHPELIATRPTISTSVIRQDHTATFADVGYILKVPAENVLAASPDDRGTFVKDRQELEQLKERRDIYGTVDQLVRASSALNEVVVTGKTEAGETEIVGIFYKCYRDSPDQPIGSSRELKILNLMRAKLPELPVVKIFKPEPYSETKAELWKDQAGVFCGLALNYNGKRYVARFKDDSWNEFSKIEYEVIDRDYKSHRMTKPELDMMLDIAKNHLSADDSRLVEEKTAEILEAHSQYKGGDKLPTINSVLRTDPQKIMQELNRRIGGSHMGL